MKKVFKNPIFMFILGAIIFGTIGVVATNTITASSISYGNGTVETAINNLYTKAKPDYSGTVIYTPSDTIQIIPTKDTILRSNIVINQIPSNYKELSSLTHELTASDLLSGKQAYKADGTVVNGNISTFTPQSSYTPTTSNQTLATGGKYVNGDITIGAIPSSYKQLNGTANISADKILQGYSAFDNNGDLITGNVNASSINRITLIENKQVQLANNKSGTLTYTNLEIGRYLLNAYRTCLSTPTTSTSYAENSSKSTRTHCTPGIPTFTISSGNSTKITDDFYVVNITSNNSTITISSASVGSSASAYGYLFASLFELD